MESNSEETLPNKPVEDANFASNHAISQQGLIGMGGQNFNDVYTADHSRNHFGNVYNTIHSSSCQTDFTAAKGERMMHALEFSGMNYRLMTIKRACNDTCTWFLGTHSYTRWREPAYRHSHNGVLWIKGNPGTGKSTLMRYIHDYALKKHKHEMSLAFFFNGRSSETLVKAIEGMYRSIIYQLYDQIPRLMKAGVKSVSVTEQHIWFIPILEDLLRQAILDLRPDEAITCYVDALDECETAQVRTAIEFFEGLSRSATLYGVKFLVCFSSRYYPQITMQAHEEVRFDTMWEHAQDISVYLDNYFTLRSIHKLELQNDIERRCSGIFLWVVLVVRMLKHEFDEGATLPQLRKTLTSVPDDLNALFAKITEDADESSAAALRWVLFATQPLSCEELYLATKASTGSLPLNYEVRGEVDIETMERYILNVSRGLVEFKTSLSSDQRAQHIHQSIGSDTSSFPSPTAQFIHESVREYLLSRGLADLNHVSREDLMAASHAKIAGTGQDYLKALACEEARVLSLNADIDLRASHRADMLLDYILRNVLKHIEAAFAGGFTEVGLLFDFPVREYISLGQSQDMLAEHSATLLTLLLGKSCHASARIIIQTAADQFALTEEPYDQRGQVPSTSTAFSRPDLTTFCGGPWGSPLHAAVELGQEDLTLLLLNQGADVNLAGTLSVHGSTRTYDGPLISAIKHERKSMVSILLDHGARANSFSLTTGFNAIHLACDYSSLELVELLLRRGADANLHCHKPTDWFDGFTALHIAIAWPWPGSSRMIKTLLGAGANVNAADAQYRTALHVVVAKSHTSLTRALLEAGADLNTMDNRGMTPLMRAVSIGSLANVEVLLEYGADVSFRSSTAGTALDLAYREKDMEIARSLLDAVARQSDMQMTAPAPKRQRRRALLER